MEGVIIFREPKTHCGIVILRLISKKKTTFNMKVKKRAWTVADKQNPLREGLSEKQRGKCTAKQIQRTRLQGVAQFWPDHLVQTPSTSADCSADFSPRSQTLSTARCLATVDCRSCWKPFRHPPPTTLPRLCLAPRDMSDCITVIRLSSLPAPSLPRAFHIGMWQTREEWPSWRTALQKAQGKEMDGCR